MTWADISVWVVTFALTVFADLTVAVEIGMSLAALLYIRKVTRTTTVSTRDARVHRRRPAAHPAGQADSRLRHGLPHPRPVPVRRDGKDARGRPDAWIDLAPIVILRLRNMTAIDATGLLTLEELADKLQASGRR